MKDLTQYNSQVFMGKIPDPAVSHLQSPHLRVSAALLWGELVSAQQLSPWTTLSKQTLFIFLALLGKMCMLDFSICKVSFPLKY